MSDINSILNTHYFHDLRHEMYNKYIEWVRLKSNNPAYDLIYLDKQFKELLYSKLEKIAVDIELLNEDSFSIFKINLKLEIDSFNNFDKRKMDTSFYGRAKPRINEYINHIENSYLKRGNLLIEIGTTDPKSKEVEFIKDLPNETEINKIEFDVNFWDKDCFGLFNFLSDNYNATAQKQKFINIWFYLKYHTRSSYVFNYPKDKYKPYILSRFNIDIKKLNKPNNFDNQLIILNNHFTNYCNMLNEMK